MNVALALALAATSAGHATHRPSGRPAAPRTAGDCSGSDRYAALATFGRFKNLHRLGTVTDATRVQSTLIARQHVAADRWRQVTRWRYPRADGTSLEAIVISDENREECSLAEPLVFEATEVREPR